MPLVSVITVVYNDKDNILSTIESTTNQTYLNIELIIVDGNSKDGTIEIIRKNEYRIDYWISEPDNGIFDAMNKGIALSNGNWVNFMNAGDRFFNLNVIEQLNLPQYSNYSIVYGNAMIGDRLYGMKPLTHIHDGRLMACHQSMFFNKSLLKDELFYDLKFKYRCDHELVMRLYVNDKYKFVSVDLVIAFFLGGGFSSQTAFESQLARVYYLFKYFGIRGVLNGISNKIRFIKERR